MDAKMTRSRTGLGRLLAAALLAMGATPALTQTPDSRPTPTLPPSANRSAVPVPGDNKISEADAKARLESAGYANVSNLHLDGDGIWRGVGTKQGKSVDVSLDYQGNIFPR
jgi:hypothetical protein